MTRFALGAPLFHNVEANDRILENESTLKVHRVALPPCTYAHGLIVFVWKSVHMQNGFHFILCTKEIIMLRSISSPQGQKMADSV